jgi:hypothetical protein
MLCLHILIMLLVHFRGTEGGNLKHIGHLGIFLLKRGILYLCILIMLFVYHRGTRHEGSFL